MPTGIAQRILFWHPDCMRYFFISFLTCLIGLLLAVPPLDSSGSPGLTPFTGLLSSLQGGGRRALLINPKTDGDRDKDVSASVFRVLSTTVNSGGTGFLLKLRGRPVIMTAAHVCQIPTVERTFLVENSKGRYTAKVVRMSRKQDVCILALPRNFSFFVHPPFDLAAEDSNPGDVIQSVGYPLLVKQIHSKGIYLAKEAYSSPVTQIWHGAGKATFKAIPGESGSPILNQYGEVIGVLVSYEVADPRNQADFINLDYLQEFVNQ